LLNLAKAKRVLLLGFVPEANASVLASRLVAELHTIDSFSDPGSGRTAAFDAWRKTSLFPTELDLTHEDLSSFHGSVLIVAVNILELLADPPPALAFMPRVLMLDEGNLLLRASPDSALSEPANSQAKKCRILDAVGPELVGKIYDMHLNVPLDRPEDDKEARSAETQSGFAGFWPADVRSVLFRGRAGSKSR